MQEYKCSVLGATPCSPLCLHAWSAGSLWPWSATGGRCPCRSAPGTSSRASAGFYCRSPVLLREQHNTCLRVNDICLVRPIFFNGCEFSSYLLLLSRRTPAPNGVNNKKRRSEEHAIVCILLRSWTTFVSALWQRGASGSPPRRWTWAGTQKSQLPISWGTTTTRRRRSTYWTFKKFTFRKLKWSHGWIDINLFCASLPHQNPNMYIVVGSLGLSSLAFCK